MTSLAPPPPKPQGKLMDLLESNGATAVMTSFTLYALYADDTRVYFFDSDADAAFDWLSGTALLLFAVELFVFSFMKEGYFSLPTGNFAIDVTKHQSYLQLIWQGCATASFYFWLDLLATTTMIFDIQYFDVLNQNDPAASDYLESAKASKASKAGARAGRVVRIIRMVRLLRLVKLFKYFSDKKKEKDGRNVIPADDDVENLPPESHVGAAMSDLTTKRVIIMILGMLIAIPMLGVDETAMYTGMKTPENFFVSTFMDTNSTASGTVANMEFAKNYIFKEKSMNCMGVNTGDCDDESCFEQNVHLEYPYYDYKFKSIGQIKSTLRSSEYDQIRQGSTAFYFYKRDDNQDSALLGVLLTSFVILLLGGGTMQFSSEVNRLVLIPIEKMVQLVREISENPLKKEFTSVSKSELDDSKDGMETTLLLQTITKIAGLMRVGFGEAGAEIISKNLANGDHKTMNLLGSGVKIESIFGFCDVRNFTDTTECLQEEVMLFVNRIAHILHGIVVQCHGSANKNIGDAFLLTWKIIEKKRGKGGEQEFVGDEALLSLLKTTAEMARHEEFICNFSPSALSTLYERMPGYKCKMGCGLHMGWAIEGAIGSDKKIDASYISPHVNWSEFLESSTKEYGVPILMSEPFFKLLSPNVTKWCRQVDNIKKSESDEVTGLYTYDVNPDIDFAVFNNDKNKNNENGAGGAGGRRNTRKKSLSSPVGSKQVMSKRQSYMKPKTGSAMRSFRNVEETIPEGENEVLGDAEISPNLTKSPSGSIRRTGQVRPSMLLTEGGGGGGAGGGGGGGQSNHGSIGDAPEILLEKFTVDIWEKDLDLVAMRSHMNDEIRVVWGQGMGFFIAGDWQAARDKFARILEITNGKDGPTINLLRHMDNDYEGGVPPADWKGYRDMS